VTGNVCWHDGRQGPWHTCPYDQYAPGDRDVFRWGRCRSGRRWFWAAAVLRYYADGDRAAHGWSDTEPEAVTAARESVADLAAGRPAIAHPMHGHARLRLKEINAEKRRARPSTGSADAGPVEYLYGETWNNEDCVRRVVAFPIQRKTAKRIYYIRSDDEIGYVNRQDLEANGEVHNRAAGWWSPYCVLHATPPDVATEAEPADLAQLRREAADAHPDRGGTNEAFRAAYARYQQAKAAVRR
jgi:hypothetical protein